MNAGNGTSNAVAMAMQKVLAAEQESEHTIQIAKKRADALRNDAQGKAQHIRSRTNKRIRRLQKAYSEKTRTLCMQLQAEARTASEGSETIYSDAMLDEAIAGIVDRLTGVTNETEA